MRDRALAPFERLRAYLAARAALTPQEIDRFPLTASPEGR